MIKERLQVYLPLVQHCQELYEECLVIDLGCGRGEWLELLAENGFDVYGVDLDEGMLAACEERNLPAEKKDALVALQELPDESRAIVSGFHIAEHLPFKKLQEIVKESLRVLKPGGLLILETPNPENIIVGTANFYLDPTHQRPLPPELLAFLPEHYGFARTKVLRLQEPAELRDSPGITMGDIFGGVSPDYAVIAQKKATKRRMALFDEDFAKERGLTIETLAARYDTSIADRIGEVETMALLRAEQTRNETVERIGEIELKTAERIDSIEQAAGKRIGELRGDIAALDRLLEASLAEHQRRMDETNVHVIEHNHRFEEVDLRINEHQRRLDEAAEVQARLDETQAHFARTLEAKSRELEARTLEMEAAFHAIRNSRSWKMTAPYRALGDFVRASWQGFKNLLKPPLSAMMRFVIARPSLNRCALALLRPFPGLKARLKRLAVAGGVVELPENNAGNVVYKG